MAELVSAVTYVLPHRTFFAPGRAGQVVHAEGVLDGLRPLTGELHLLAAREAEEHLPLGASGVALAAPRAGRRWWNLRMARLLMRHIDRHDPDVVLVRSHPVFLLVSALWLAASSRRRARLFCVEVNGLGFSFARPGGGNALVIGFSTLAYRLLLRPFDYVQTVNDDLAERLVSGRAGLAKRRVLVVHNGGPRPNYPQAPVDNDVPELHLFFYGLFNGYNDFPLLIDSVHRVNADGRKVVLHLIGHGREGDYLRSRADGDTVRLYEPMSREEFAAHVRGTRGLKAGVLPMRFGNGSGSLSPLKAFEYMALGMPLLYSSNCLQDVLTDDVHGVMYAEGDGDAMVAQIARLTDRDRYARMSAEIRELYPEHTWEQRMESLLSRMLAAESRAN